VCHAERGPPKIPRARSRQLDEQPAAAIRMRWANALKESGSLSTAGVNGCLISDVIWPM
jgi:hypothetical protein